MVEDYEVFEYLQEAPIPPLTESNLRDKKLYEARRFDALCAKFDAHRGNYGWFAGEFGDIDIIRTAIRGINE